MIMAFKLTKRTKKGSWTTDEDVLLSKFVGAHGGGNWCALAKRAGLKRSGKSCRLRWMNYLRPNVKWGNISPDEEDLIIRLHKLLGNRWSLIAGRIPGRTDTQVKNYWNTHLSKKCSGVQSSKTQQPTNVKGYTACNYSENIQEKTIGYRENPIFMETVNKDKTLSAEGKEELSFGSNAERVADFSMERVDLETELNEALSANLKLDMFATVGIQDNYPDSYLNPNLKPNPDFQKNALLASCSTFNVDNNGCQHCLSPHSPLPLPGFMNAEAITIAPSTNHYTEWPYSLLEVGVESNSYQRHENEFKYTSCDSQYWPWIFQPENGTPDF